MQALPDELHLSIAHFLPPKDLLTYRLISKRFAIIGAELIFSVFKFDGYAETLHRLNGYYKRHITALDFDCLPKSDLVPVNNWKVEPYIGTDVFVEVLEVCSRAGVRLTDMTAGHIPLSFFKPNTFPPIFSSACAQITQLSLNICGDTLEGSGTLRQFLASLTNLQSLTLHFGPQSQVLEVNGRGVLSPRYDRSGPRAFLYNAFPRGRTWLKLRILSVQYVKAATDDLVFLIRDHKQTLQELHLAHIKLDRPAVSKKFGWSVAMWRRVFSELGEMENLEGASVFQWIRPSFTDRSTWTVDTARRSVKVPTNLTQILAHDGVKMLPRGM
jgi:hypothetical protein